MKNLKNLPHHLPKNIFFILICGTIFFNLLELPLIFKNFIQYRPLIAQYPIGAKFIPFKDIFPHTQFVSYVSDSNVHSAIGNKEFTQAQYALAPIVLDGESTNHLYILINCSSQQKAFEELIKIKATPLKTNNRGLIAAQRSL